LRTYFDQAPDGTTAINTQRFEDKYELLSKQLKELSISDVNAKEILKELIRTKSVLAALVGLRFEDSIWEQLDAKGKYQNTIIAIINLFLGESLIQPIVIQLEDGHWIDESSEELLSDLIKQIHKYPIFLLITSRYHDDGTKPILIEQELLATYQIPFLEINLSYLSSKAVRKYAVAFLRGKLHPDFYGLLLRSTNSNPFYLQQVLEYFQESDLLTQEDGIWNIKDHNIQLSSSINAILTARIDRLSTLVKETVKAAAVIGREFEVPILAEVMKRHENFSGNGEAEGSVLKEQIVIAEQGQIWQAMNELSYIFKHSLLREAAYSMQLKVRLQQLHQLIAEAIERIYHNNLEERFVDLAFHYEQAGVFDKTCEYLRKAADYARGNYQNHQALDFYERLLQKLNTQHDDYAQIQTHLKRGKILELIGKWDDCQRAYELALQLAKQSRDVLLLGQAHNSLGRVLMLKGEYAEAMDFLQKAAGLFESFEDYEGIASVYGNLGNLYFRQGKYEEAKSYFTNSIDLSRKYSLEVRPMIVANLGLTHMNQGNYDDGIVVMEEQKRYCELHNDKQGMATINTFEGILLLEKGDYDLALENFEKGLALSEELGNQLLMPIAIGNIGLIYERQGDYGKAMENYQRDLEICEEMGDKQGIAIALGLIGQLLNIKGDFYKAIEYLQKALMLSEELGYQKGIAKAVNTLGDVFFLTDQYERSLYFYNRAIDVTRRIGNKLVLGFSLVEKGAVLLELNDISALDKLCTEALELAAELGNPDLLFEAEILLARLFILKGDYVTATDLLDRLEAGILGKDQEAALKYERFRISPEDENIRKEALELYESLFAQTPKHVFKRRVEELNQVDGSTAST
ncbi:MAG: tetratricopeptide repeat protein, partial [Bacteroidota bacterium]